MRDPDEIWPYMVQYLQFRILEFLLKQSLAVETMGKHPATHPEGHQRAGSARSLGRQSEKRRSWELETSHDIAKIILYT